MNRSGEKRKLKSAESLCNIQFFGPIGAVKHPVFTGGLSNDVL